MRSLAQKLHLCAAIRHRIDRKLIAKIFQRKLQRATKASACCAIASGKSAKNFSISAEVFRWRSALRASKRPAFARLRWCRMHVNTSSSSRCSRLGIRHAIGRQQRQRQFPRNFNRSLIARFFFAAKMSLQFDIHIVLAKNLAKLFALLGSRRSCRRCQRVCQRPFFAAGQANQPAGRICSKLGTRETRLRLFSRAISST